MTADTLDNWNTANQQYLMAAIREVQAELEIVATGQKKQQKGDEISNTRFDEAKSRRKKAAEALPAVSALENLVTMLKLSSFERKILLICAGVELDSELAELIADLKGHPGQLLPTFSLALASFKDAHWSALSPHNPLRYWRLVELTDHQLVTKSPIRIDEQVLHYITGISAVDERLREIIEPVPPDRFLVHSHQDVADRIIRSCIEQMNNLQPVPVILLNGDDEDKAGVAVHVSIAFGKMLYSVSAYSIPVLQREFSEFIRLVNRESALNGYALLLDCSELDTMDKIRLLYLHNFIENIRGLLFISSDRWSPKTNRHSVVLDVLKPSRTEQISLWQVSLGEHAIQLNGHMDKLVSQFDLSAKMIQQISTEIESAQSLASQEEQNTNNDFALDLVKLCCKHTRPKIDDLAQRVEPVAVWDDIVLPEAQKDILREIAMQVKQRKKVYNDWGFAGTCSRGLGISTIFTGESGTGKTMAAEVLANELQTDLYRIDLSQVVNKYIGETEKNLKRIFDSAERGGAILLFDEADALFGKRSEVKDSHDRYSNIEVSYLLQRMEAYRGLAILTTNMKNALDKSFLRRIRFMVQFPFPGVVQRAEIWGKVFPRDTPLTNLDLGKLAKLSLPGGNIRNIALNAAFIAADENTSVSMSHILRAARSEYNKLEKTMNNIESDN